MTPETKSALWGCFLFAIVALVLLFLLGQWLWSLALKHVFVT